MKRFIFKSVLLLTLILVVTAASVTTAFGMEIREYFKTQAKSGILTCQQEKENIQKKIEELKAYTPKADGRYIMITGTIEARDGNTILVKGSGIMSNSQYFIIEDPDPVAIVMDYLYNGLNIFIGNESLSNGMIADRVGPAPKNPYLNEIKKLNNQYKELDAKLAQLKTKANFNEDVTDFTVNGYKYYVMDGFINGMNSTNMDYTNGIVSGIGYMEWDGGYFAGEIKNNLPNGGGFIINSLPNKTTQGYLAEELPNMERRQSGYWVDGKYSILNNYDADSQSTILFQINSPLMRAYEEYRYIEEGNLSAKPMLVGGSTMLPIRPLIEVTGGNVTYDNASKQVSITLADKQIQFILGQNTALVNGEKVLMDVKAQVINGKTMIPLRFVAENLGMSIKWDQANKVVVITYPEGYGQNANEEAGG
ncbi:MAG: stalk domain-containing protein [Aminipila sp.]